MSCDVVIDSYAWIEYFKGSEYGKKAKEYIENGICATPTIVFETAKSENASVLTGDEHFKGVENVIYIK